MVVVNLDWLCWRVNRGVVLQAGKGPRAPFLLLQQNGTIAITRHQFSSIVVVTVMNDRHLAHLSQLSEKQQEVAGD